MLVNLVCVKKLDPKFTVDVVLPYAVVVPHSKLPVVANPDGLTVPFNRALVFVTFVAGSVTTVGGPVTLS